MNKKILTIICVILIILLGIFIGSYFFNSSNTVSIGNEGVSYVSVPSGFDAVNFTHHSVVLTDGISSFTVYEFTNKSLGSILKEYDLKHKNDSIEEVTMMVDNIAVTGQTLEVNNTIIHTNYYFVKNNITYQIYPSGKENQDIFKKIINSIKLVDN